MSVELKRLNKNKLSIASEDLRRQGRAEGQIIYIVDIFILNYIYNSKMALPGRSPWLPLWGSRQEKLSVCLVSKLHNCGVQKLKL